MKSHLVIFFLVSLVALAKSVPRSLRTREDSVRTKEEDSNINVPLLIPNFDIRFEPDPFGFNDDRVSDSDSDDIDVDDMWPSYNPFRGFWNIFEERLRQLRKQMNGQIPSLMPPGEIPENKNETSVTKVIDGHIVTINRTTYSGDNPGLGYILKISTIDIKPDNSNATQTINNNNDNDNADNGGGEQVDKDKLPEQTTQSNNSTSERSVESIENPGNNEIPNNQVEILQA